MKKSFITASLVALVAGHIPAPHAPDARLAPYHGGALFPNGDLHSRGIAHNQPIEPCTTSTSLPVVATKSSKPVTESSKYTHTSVAAGGVASQSLASSSISGTTSITPVGSAAIPTSKLLALSTFSLFTRPRTTTTTTIGAGIRPMVPLLASITPILSTFTMDGVTGVMEITPSIVFETTITVTENLSTSTIPDAQSQMASTSTSPTFDLVTVISTLTGLVSTIGLSNTASIGPSSSSSSESLINGIISSSSIPVSSADTFTALPQVNTSSTFESVVPTPSSTLIVATTSFSSSLAVPTSSSLLIIVPPSSSNSQVLLASSSVLIIATTLSSSALVVPMSSSIAIVVSSSSSGIVATLITDSFITLTPLPTSSIASSTAVFISTPLSVASTSNAETSSTSSAAVEPSAVDSSIEAPTASSSTIVVQQSSTTTILSTVTPTTLASSFISSQVSFTTPVSPPDSSVASSPDAVSVPPAMSQVIGSATTTTSQIATTVVGLSTMTTSSESSDVTSNATEAPSSSIPESGATSEPFQLPSTLQTPSDILSVSKSLSALTPTSPEAAFSTCSCLTITLKSLSTHSAQTSIVSIPGLVGLPHTSETYVVPASTQTAHITTTINLCPTTSVFSVPILSTQSTTPSPVVPSASNIPSTPIAETEIETESTSSVYLSVPENSTAPTSSNRPTTSTSSASTPTPSISTLNTHTPKTSAPMTPTPSNTVTTEEPPQSTITSTIITEVTRSPSTTAPTPSMSIIYTGIGATSRFQDVKVISFVVGFIGVMCWV